jgi:hypothetical protein
LFPGFVAVALALIGAFVYRPRRHEGTKNVSFAPLAYFLGLLIAIDISLGFNGVTYRVLYRYVLPFRGLRVPARMGIMAGFSLAVLAGYGVAWLMDRIRPSRVAPALTLIAALILTEYASRPIDMMIIPMSPLPVYADMLRDVGDSPPASVVEFPVSDKSDPTYMYYSTFHWQSLVNGYSGFFPRWYREFTATLLNLPDGGAIGYIKRRHRARYLIIHGERLYGGRYPELIEALDRRADLKLVSRTPAAREGQHGEASLYRILY